MPIHDFNRILKVINQHTKEKSRERRFNLIPSWLRIVAMLIVFFSVGGIIMYQQVAIDPLIEFAQKQTEDNPWGLLILSDGSQQILKDKDSFIDYDSKVGEVVIQEDKQELIIENKEHAKKPKFNQIVVPYGQRQRVLLSDGTLVQLNAGSKLTFPATFSGKTREVYLSGEGFFEVCKNAEAPFIVKTSHVDIKVLGTKFNVASYDDEQIVATVLVEGRVNVAQKNKIFDNEQFKLTAGQGCFYSIGNQSSVVRSVDVNNYVLWKEGMYKFKNTPLYEVINRLHKYYNQPVQIEGERLSNTLVSGKLVLTENLEEVLRTLSKTMEGKLEKKSDGHYLMKY